MTYAGIMAACQGRIMNNRRKLIVALVAGAFTVPRATVAQQQGKVWRIGILAQLSGPNKNIEAFLEGLRSLGYVEGRNLSIEYRWAAGTRGR